MIPVIQGRAENAGGAMAASLYGSILPAAWSFMLALRERGLGSAWTTLHLLGEGEREAADILGIPFETHSQVGLFPVAYTVGTDFKPAKRLPLSQVSHWNSW
jgi:nitroreductase